MPFNSASDAFQLHPDVRSYGTYLRNLIDDKPSFWSSDELWETLETGEVLAIDYEHFSSVLYRRLRVDAEARARGRPSDADAARLLDLVDEYVGAENFSLLCQKTLQFLNEDDLCAFTRGLLQASALEDPKTTSGKRFYYYGRWGRTGIKGQCKLDGPMLEDKAKATFAFTDCIPLVYQLIIHCPEPIVGKELIALAVNLTSN